MTMSEVSPQVAKENSESNSANNAKQLNEGVQEVDNSASVSGGVSVINAGENGSIINDNFSTNGNAATPVKRGKGKNVKFPDSGFVASYDEPKDPWKNAKHWTTEELVLSYKKSCDKHGTKPLARLVQQLQKISYTGKRHESLILKGEKLDQKHCECIEEIFRRVQFRNIDLESSHLDDECAVALFDMIEFYSSACHLNISFNKNISLRGWQSCSRLIRRTPCLTALDMRNCDLNERSIPIMGRALKMGSHLTILHLENIYLSGRPLVILVAALKMNENLSELFLADNKLMPSDGIQLGILLKYNHKLELLDLRNNHLQDVGTRHLSEGLAEQKENRGLLTLVLWNNQITYQGMPALAVCLACVTNLETLNLGHNNVTNEGIHLLKEGLLKNKSLLRLGLQGTKVTCEGAVALAEYVAESIKLLRLDLRENEIKTAGLMGLSLALRMNETITRIDLDKETKKESGMKDYADQQKRLQQEILSYQERNQIRALEREEEERRKLEERAQQEEELRHAAQELKDAQLVEDAMSYIPNSDKIERPTMLFTADQPAQQTLESPMVNIAQNNKVSEILSPILSPVSTVPAYLSPPPADLILSPQYSPKLTAKKIFTVSRVNDNQMKIVSPVLESPVACIDVSNMIDSKQVLVTPSTLCQNLATETMSDYIEHIVAEAIKSEVKEFSSLQTESVCNSHSDVQNDGTNIIEETQNHAACVNGVYSDKNVEQTNCTPTNSVREQSSDSLNCDSDSSGLPAPSRKGLFPLESETVQKLSPIDWNSSNEDSSHSIETCEPHTSIQLTDSIVAELSIVPQQQEMTSFDMMSDSDVLQNCDEDKVTVDNNLNIAKPVLDSAKDNIHQEVQSTSLDKSSDGGVEVDPWLEIGSLDFVQQNKFKGVGDTNKPDFHTNLTMNGLTQELASALDISEETTDTSVTEDRESVTVNNITTDSTETNN